MSNHQKSPGKVLQTGQVPASLAALLVSAAVTAMALTFTPTHAPAKPYATALLAASPAEPNRPAYAVTGEVDASWPTYVGTQEITTRETGGSNAWGALPTAQKLDHSVLNNPQLPAGGDEAPLSIAAYD